MAGKRIVRDDIVGVRLKADLDSQLVAIDMLDVSDDTIEIVLPGHAIFDIQDQIAAMLEANPEMLGWRTAPRRRH